MPEWHDALSSGKTTTFYSGSEIIATQSWRICGTWGQYRER